MSRILDRAFLVAKVGIDQPISLGITLRPLEVVEKCPGMEGAHPGSIGDRARQFRERFAVPLDTTPIRYATILRFIGSIEITTSALGDFDDRVVVLPCDLTDKVIHATRQHFKAGVCKRTLRGPPSAEPR